MGKIKAVLFDIDGTLVDTEESIFQGMNHGLALHGFPLMTRGQMRATAGMYASEVYQTLYGTSDAMTEALIALHRAHIKAHPELQKPYPGTLDVLNKLKRKEAGLLLGVVTNRREVMAVHALETNGLHAHFDVVVPRDHVQKPKPHPEPLLNALEKLRKRAPDLKADECLYVGDDRNDMESGRRAGMVTVHARYGTGGDNPIPPQFKPHHEIHSIREVLQLV